MISRLNKWFLTACCLAIFAMPAFAGKPPGGGGDPPPPQLPAVRYLVDVIPIPGTQVWVNQINNNGVVVGHVANQAFLYNHTADVFYSLNSDEDLQPLRDQLADQFGPNWFFNSAIGINDSGQVVGRVEDSVTGVTDGFALDTAGLASPEFWTLLPLPALDSGRVNGRRINEFGDVLGEYQRLNGSWDCFLCNPWTPEPLLVFGLNLKFGDSNVELNNFGQVAGILSDGTAFFDTNPSPGLPALQTYGNVASCSAIGGVNDLGVSCVNGRQKTGKRLNLLGPNTAFRYDGFADQPEALLEGGNPEAINSAGDVAIYASGPSYLAYNGSASFPKQVLKVTDLVPDSNPLKIVLVNNAFRVDHLNDRNATGFSQLTGRVWVTQPDGTVQFMGVVLTPYIP